MRRTLDKRLQCISFMFQAVGSLPERLVTWQRWFFAMLHNNRSLKLWYLIMLEKFISFFPAQWTKSIIVFQYRAYVSADGLEKWHGNFLITSQLQYQVSHVSQTYSTMDWPWNPQMQPAKWIFPCQYDPSVHLCTILNINKDQNFLKLDSMLMKFGTRAPSKGKY